MGGVLQRALLGCLALITQALSASFPQVASSSFSPFQGKKERKGDTSKNSSPLVSTPEPQGPPSRVLVHPTSCSVALASPQLGNFPRTTFPTNIPTPTTRAYDHSGRRVPFANELCQAAKGYGWIIIGCLSEASLPFHCGLRLPYAFTPKEF